MRKIAILLIVFSLMTGFASAQTANETRNALEEAQDQIILMEEQEIPTERVENLLETANNSYLAQKNFAEEGGTADYSRAMEIAQQISEIQDRAIRASDRIEALNMRLNELEDTSVNLTSAKNELEAAKTDFNSQRFEEADSHIDSGYSAISDAQSAQTQVESFAAAQQEAITSRINTVVSYVRSNPEKVGATSIVSIILLTFILKEFRTYRLLKIRKRKRIKEEVLENLITDIQREYYMKKEGSAIEFETKLDRFEEMRRDVVEDIEVIDRKLEGRWTVIWDISEHIEETEDIENKIEDKEEVEEENVNQSEDKEVQEPEQSVEETDEPEKQDEDTSEEKNDEEPDEENNSQDEKIEVYQPSEDEEETEDEEDSEDEESFTCPECGDEFDTKRGMHIHQSQKHDSEDEDESGGVECPVCGDTFDTERGMHIHRGEVHDN